MIGLGAVYLVAGAMFAGFAALAAARRRWGNAAFWAMLATSFLAGDRIGDLANGALVLALTALAACGALRPPQPSPAGDGEREASAAVHGNRLFLPALIIPAVALAGTLAGPHLAIGTTPLIDPKQASLVGLALGAVLAVGVVLAWLRPPPVAAAEEGLRLADGVGWALVLPQALAGLGALFALAGVGGQVGRLAGGVLPADAPTLGVLLFGGGMALLTIAMGNAFAAFPVMMGAVGLPLLVRGDGGNPAPIAAIGMLSGFCGTLLTPMAANFNLVPVRLLELRDRWAVIRVQAPTALMLLAVNLVLMRVVAFR